MFKEIIINLLKEKIPLSEKEIKILIEIPPNPELGDYSFPCFSLSDTKPKNDEMWEDVEPDFFIKKSPVEIANHLKEIINNFPKEIEKIETKGSYLNFFINKKELAKTIIKINNNFGKGEENNKIMIEYSQPNTHKSFHVGHIRGTAIGESLARIFEKLGNKVIRANYSGDTGMHIAKWIWCYLNFHSKEKLSEDESWIAGIYVEAVKRLSENPDLQEQVNEINREIEQKSNKKIYELWKKTKNLSVKSWEKIYKELGTRFDRHYFESELEQSGKKISLDLLKKGIAERSQEAVIMNLEKYNLGIWVLLRKDNTVLYSAKDIALARSKLNEQDLDEYLIITADEQNLHFQQLFKTLELMKEPKKDKFRHLGFGIVRFPHGKMSSRTGDNIIYSEFKKELVEFAKKPILEKWPKISRKEVENRALKVAIASIKYSMLAQDPRKLIIFDKEKAMNFEGNTGPYLQYSYARASSIIRKAKTKNKNKSSTNKIPDLTQQEIGLIKKISFFPEIIQRAKKNLNPSLIANYSFELSQAFNEFYHTNKVIGSKEEAFRLKLTDAFRITLHNSLHLLGIEVMDEM
jgi:arginyl-tRNA synthetase